jgi:hypothetical protein
MRSAHGEESPGPGSLSGTGIVSGAGRLARIGSGDASSPRLLVAVPGCPICDLWKEYEDIVIRAKQEVAPLHNGVLYFYYSADPSVIEPLIRFAHERTKLADRLTQDETLRAQLGGPCLHKRLYGSVHLEISTSARGIFAILTTDDPTMFGWLRDKARMATRRKIPFWF